MTRDHGVVATILAVLLALGFFALAAYVAVIMAVAIAGRRLRKAAA